MPNRILKESICSSDSIDQLSAFQETFFYRLIVSCDDYGRMDARPKLLASKLYPLKDIRATQIEDALRALTSAELVTLYEVDGKPFLQMNTWDRHQQVRAKKSKYPAPEDSVRASASICNQLISDDGKCPRNPIQSESNPNPNTNPTTARAREASSSPSCVDQETEKHDREVEQAAREVGLQLTPAGIKMARILGAKYGHDKLLEAIRLSVDHPLWSYVEGVLRNYGKPKQTGKVNPSLNYLQREDTERKPHEMPEWLKQVQEQERQEKERQERDQHGDDSDPGVSAGGAQAASA